MFRSFMSYEEANDFTYFGFLHPFSVGFVVTYFQALRKLQDACSYDTCKYLCERTMNMNSNFDKQHDGVTRDDNMRTGHGDDIHFIAANTSSIRFPFVQCPAKHVTHAFLAFDVSSQCYEEDAYSMYECGTSTNPWFPSCRLDLQSLSVPFQCSNGMQNVPYTLVCDHIPDCQDDSDEQFCDFPPCPFPKYMQCLHKHECVLRRARCDGIPECIDKSDETNCRQTSRFAGTEYQGKPPFIVDMEGPNGFPVLTPLDDPLFSRCPDTHFQCPRDQNCLPVNMRCNGVFDCSHREDELRCETYTCPNFYRCRGSQVCVHPYDLCDGKVHCPRHDDERFCHLNCSDSCTCLGHSMKCSSPFAAHEFPQMKYLDGRGSRMTMREVANNNLLIYLNLASCNIRTFENVTLRNLRILDLSDNQLEALSMGDMLLVPKLKRLCVTRNPISSLFLTSQTTNHSLEELDVSYGNFRDFSTHVLVSFKSLLVLNLSHNNIQHVQDGGLHSLPETVHVLDTRGCPIKTFPRNFFKGLKDLQIVYADNYKLCCPVMFPPKFVSENCHAPFDEVSSCEDLLRSNIYRVPLFMLTILALLGNFISFTARMTLKRSKVVSGFGVFVLHLCFSDFLMGVYLVFIGVADRVYQGRYLWQDTSWRHSVACKLAGFVSVMSSEVSAFIICLIALDRFIVLRFPFSTFRFGYSSAQIVSIAVWIIGFALATIPLLPVTSYWQFYSQTGICIPLPVTRKGFYGHGYAFGVMITLNFALFLLIATGQAFVYVTIQSSKMSDSETSKKSQDATIARRLITVVVSDFLCWFPIGLLGLLAAGGTPIPGEVNVAMAIFVLPLNSALNPFLYTLNMIQEYREKHNEDKLFQKILLQKDAFDDIVNSK